MKAIISLTESATGATSIIDTVEDVAPDYTAEKYIADCSENADAAWNQALESGTVSAQLDLELSDFCIPGIVKTADTDEIIDLIEDADSWNNIGMEEAMGELLRRTDLEWDAFYSSESPNEAAFNAACNVYYGRNADDE